MEELLTVTQASKVLKTNRNYVYDCIKRKEINVVKLKSLRIKRSEIERFMTSHEVRYEDR